MYCVNLRGELTLENNLSYKLIMVNQALIKTHMMFLKTSGYKHHLEHTDKKNMRIWSVVKVLILTSMKIVMSHLLNKHSKRNQHLID